MLDKPALPSLCVAESSCLSPAQPPHVCSACGKFDVARFCVAVCEEAGGEVASLGHCHSSRMRQLQQPQTANFFLFIYLKYLYVYTSV